MFNLLTIHQLMNPHLKNQIDWDKYSTYANIIYLVSGVVVTICTIIVYLTGSMAQKNLKDRLNQQTTTANENAAKANKKAAEANENAAKANEEAVKAKQKLALLTIDVSNAKTRQAEAEKALLELQHRFRLRVLSPQQKAVLHDELIKVPNGSIILTHEDSDQEAAQFQRQFEEVFREAGWRVTVERTIGGIQFNGVVLFFSKQGVPPPYMMTVEKMMFWLGLGHETAVRDGLQPGELMLSIGKREN